MKVGISISIDVTKIDGARIFNGKKGKYIDLTTFIDLDQKDQYDNNGFISQTVSKDERAQGVKTPILGNCKVFFTDSNNSVPGQQHQPDQHQGQHYGRQQTQQAPQQQAGGFEEFPDDIPF